MRNFRTVEFLIQHGGSELLAENLVAIVDQVRPMDYLAAAINKTNTAIPWTLRIHDIGDYPEFRTIQSSKSSEQKIKMVSHFDSPSQLQHSA